MWFFRQFENLHFIYIDSRWCTNLLQDSLLLSPENRSLRWLRECIRIWVDNMRKCRLFTLWNGIMFSSYVLTQKKPPWKLHLDWLSIGILLPKLFWPTVRKNCSSDREKLLKFEAEGREFANFLRSLEQFIQTVKC